MKTLLRRLRGALGMGLTWALGWAVVGGAVMEGIVDPDGRILDMWPQTLAIPGFLGGVVFAFLLWIAEGRRRFDELSLPRFGLWGRRLEPCSDWSRSARERRAVSFRCGCGPRSSLAPSPC